MLRNSSVNPVRMSWRKLADRSTITPGRTLQAVTVGHWARIIFVFGGQRNTRIRDSRQPLYTARLLGSRKSSRSRIAHTSGRVTASLYSILDRDDLRDPSR